MKCEVPAVNKFIADGASIDTKDEEGKTIFVCATRSIGKRMVSSNASIFLIVLMYRREREYVSTIYLSGLVAVWERTRSTGSMFWFSNFVEALNRPIVRSETLGAIARPDAEKCLHASIACCGEFAG
jgi:hypothetical protein